MSIETPAASPTQPPAGQPVEQLADQPLAEDLLVEEVSIDGMCGVY